MAGWISGRDAFDIGEDTGFHPKGIGIFGVCGGLVSASGRRARPPYQDGGPATPVTPGSPPIAPAISSSSIEQEPYRPVGGPGGRGPLQRPTQPGLQQHFACSPGEGCQTCWAAGVACVRISPSDILRPKEVSAKIRLPQRQAGTVTPAKAAL